jgi:formylglycine-generating enzyme required for sulfatase activity
MKILVLVLVGVMLISCSSKIGTHEVADLKKRGLTSEQIDTLRAEYDREYKRSKPVAKAWGFSEKQMVEKLSENLESTIEEYIVEAKNIRYTQRLNAYLTNLVTGKYATNPSKFKKEITPKLVEFLKLHKEYGIKNPELELSNLIEVAYELDKEGKLDKVLKTNNFYSYGEEQLENSKNASGFDTDEGVYTYASFNRFVADMKDYQVEYPQYFISQKAHLRMLYSTLYEGSYWRIAYRGMLLNMDDFKDHPVFDISGGGFSYVECITELAKYDENAKSITDDLIEN